MIGQQEIFRTSLLMSNKNFQTTKKTALRNCFLLFVMSFLINTEVLAHNGHFHHDLERNPDRELLDTPSFFPAPKFTQTGPYTGTDFKNSPEEVCMTQDPNRFEGSVFIFLRAERVDRSADVVNQFACIFNRRIIDTGETFVQNTGGIIAVCGFPPDELPKNTATAEYSHILGSIRHNSQVNYIRSTVSCHCPDGFILESSEEGDVCVRQVEIKECTEDNPVSINPCDIRTGAKYRAETDFSYGGFTLTRNYHSLNLVDVGFGVGWHNEYLKNLSVFAYVISIFEGTGRGEAWRKDDGVWEGDADSDYLFTESPTGFTVTLKRGDVHEYDLSGRLLSETDPQGKVKTYEYDAENRLIKVSNHYQQSISFAYSDDGKNHIIEVIDHQGVAYGYEYDANDNLTAVVFPDGDSDASNNPKRIYHYENTEFPNHITGITNANGERYATFAYNADGQAIESGLAQTSNSVGQQRVQLDFQSN